MADVLLAKVGEDDRIGVHLDLTRKQSGQAMRIVADRIAIGPDAESAEVQQAHGASKHLLVVKVARDQIAGDFVANSWQCLSKQDDRVEFLSVTQIAPGAVVAVLLAAGAIESGRLNVPNR